MYALNVKLSDYPSTIEIYYSIHHISMRVRVCLYLAAKIDGR